MTPKITKYWLDMIEFRSYMCSSKKYMRLEVSRYSSECGSILSVFVERTIYRATSPSTSDTVGMELLYERPGVEIDDWLAVRPIYTRWGPSDNLP